jgi:hypothetical protein
MYASKLLIAAAVAAGIVIILEFIRVRIMHRLVRHLEIADDVEIQFLQPLLVNLVFIVMLPAIVYAALYPILPFTSYRSGFFIALFVFAVGIIPFQVRHYNQYKLPSALTAFELFWNLLTLLASIGAITYLYHY